MIARVAPAASVEVGDVQVGDEVPDFELPDETGTPRKLSTLLEGGPVVLFFYPAAMTPGCTRESCHFRDVAGDFAAAGAQPVGISGDPVDKQKRFSDKYSFPFPLLSDADGTVATTFGVKRKISFLGVKRTTFVIGPDRKVRAVIASEVNMSKHADLALAALRSA
jgi:peroxiredoxin Q/BCP